MSDPTVMNGQLANDFGWRAGYKCILGYIFGHRASCCHDGIPANRHAGQNERACTNPGIVLDDNSLGSLAPIIQ